MKSLRQELDDRAHVHRALSLDGSSEGAIKGWENRRGNESAAAEKGSRSHEGYGGSRTPREGDRVKVMGKVHGAGKYGFVSITAPSGGFHVVEDNKGKPLGSYHSSDLKVKNASSDVEDAAIALRLSEELSSRASKHRALSLATKE